MKRQWPAWLKASGVVSSDDLGFIVIVCLSIGVLGAVAVSLDLSVSRRPLKKECVSVCEVPSSYNSITEI